jgi:hypothetical protein
MVATLLRILMRDFPLAEPRSHTLLIGHPPVSHRLLLQVVCHLHVDFVAHRDSGPVAYYVEKEAVLDGDLCQLMCYELVELEVDIMARALQTDW